MNVTPSLESMKRYLACQKKASEKWVEAKKEEPAKCFLTISREAGAGGITIGQRVVQLLNEDKVMSKECPWAVFDRNLVNEILKEHDLPHHVAEYMPEAKKSQVQNLLEEVFGLHPSSEKLIRETSETILHLAQLGHSVIVGRGSNVITNKLPGGLHVRLVGSMEKRIAHIQEYYNLKTEEAVEFIQTEDNGRKEYFEQHFKRNIDDPLLYDLVMNTDRIPYQEAAQIIVDRIKHLNQEL